MNAETNPARQRLNVRDWLRRFGLVLALLLICGLLAALNPAFLTWQNWVIIIRQIAINGILAVGVTYVLLSGGVDLSLGSVLALSGVVAAHFAHPGDYPLPVPVALGMLAGLLCGVVNGTLVTRGGVAPFIATLGMMTAARGLALVVSEGKPVSNLSPEFARIASGSLLGLPVPVLMLAAVAALSWVVLTRTRPGRHLYAVGGNALAARAAGINVDRVRGAAYLVCGTLAGLAGVLQASRVTTGQPNAGIAFELDAIAAVVIGGTSLTGGVGTIGGTLLGALLMGVINNGLDLLNVSSYYQQIIKGLIIVGAVWLDKRTPRE
jgi:inositol transport system permease protein